jgi:hypothetical protein
MIALASIFEDGKEEREGATEKNDCNKLLKKKQVTQTVIAVHGQMHIGETPFRSGAPPSLQSHDF